MSDAVSSSPARMPALDAVRAIGAIGVLGYHVAFNTGLSLHGTWNGLLARLDVGVAIFFVLSGFLLFRPYAYAAATGGESPPAGRYLWRRAVRILPAYWLTVVVCLTVLPQNRGAPLSDWIHHITLTQIYAPNLIRHGLTQTWSLATEVAFYLVLPLVALAAIGRRWSPVRAVVVAGGGLVITAGWVAAMAMGLLDTLIHTMWLPAYAIWFSAGIALAAVRVALDTATGPSRWSVVDDLASAPVTCWGLALALLAIASTPLAGPRDLAAPTPAQFGAKLAIYIVIAVLVLLPVAFGPVNRVKAAFSGPLARWLGAISYGIFLWHPLVIDAIFLTKGRWIFTGSPPSTFIATLAGGLLLASISYYGVEQPLQRLALRWPRRRAGSSVESHSAQPAAMTAS